METCEKPVLNVEGEKAALGPLRREFAPLYQRWMNDFETVRTLGRTAKPVTEEAQSAWLDRLLPGTETDVVFTLYDRRPDRSWRPAGCIGLNDIDLLHRKASFGIVIGEPEARGRGVGTEATRLMLDYGFTVLGLRNVVLTVVAFNPAGMRCYEKAGFKLVGRRRQSRHQAGQWHDEIYMDALASEFTSPVLAKKMLPDKTR
jgi:diamine N-acetyltransferase